MPEADSVRLNLSGFRIITFDCYGTLIDWETGILAALRPVLQAHGSRLGDEEILRLYGEIEPEAQAGEYRPYKEILRAVVRAFGTRLGFAPAAEEQQSLPDSLARWEPFPDTVQALRRLKTKYKLGILSNIDDDLFSVTRPKLGVELDHVITAQQARAYKPSIAVFRLAQKRVGIEKEHWLHAAQSVYHDVVPAQSLGISTVWVNRPSIRANAGAARQATAKPDLVVTSVRDLADLAGC